MAKPSFQVFLLKVKVKACAVLKPQNQQPQPYCTGRCRPVSEQQPVHVESHSSFRCDSCSGDFRPFQLKGETDGAKPFRETTTYHCRLATLRLASFSFSHARGNSKTIVMRKTCC